ncbi:MAG: hypothetical protein IKO23_03290 [Bacteroidales bacterium]|nr:hypothetical protein [Bacteroidales bacterium]
MDTYTNPQMLSPEELHEAHFEMATKYLESKWDGSYYELNPMVPLDETEKPDSKDFGDNLEWDDMIDEKSMSSYVPEDIMGSLGFENLLYDYNGSGYDSFLDEYYPSKCYTKLTNEQLSRINKHIQESGDIPLFEALADDRELLKLIIDKEARCYASHISDIPCQLCDCFLAIMDPKGQTSSYNLSVLLPKEAYLKLLVIMMDNRWATFNDIYRYDIDLYKTIAGILDQEVKSNYENHKPSYTVVFDEIERDVHALLGEEDESDVWYKDEEAYTDKRIYLEVRFSEKKMSVVQLLYDINGLKKYIIYNVNAKRVLEVLNVNTYHDALILLKDRFYIPHVVTLSPFYKIKEFLDHEKIGYEYLEDRMGREE